MTKRSAHPASWKTRSAGSVSAHNDETGAADVVDLFQIDRDAACARGDPFFQDALQLGSRNMADTAGR
jgi:hypothetical protein